jgi:hypothetical protein
VKIDRRAAVLLRADFVSMLHEAKQAEASCTGIK